MPYITNWNLSRLKAKSEESIQITVRRLSGEFHVYYKTTHKPYIHTVHNCSKLKTGLPIKNDDNQIIATRPNSGSAFVINYPVIQLNENSFDEVENIVEDYTKSIFYHAGFNQCVHCAFINSLDQLTDQDYLSPEEWGVQYENDLAYLEKYFKDNPDKHGSWLGLE